MARFCQNFNHFPKESWLDRNVGIGSITALAIVVFAISFALTEHKAVEVTDKAVAVADKAVNVADKVGIGFNNHFGEFNNRFGEFNNHFGNAIQLLAIFLAASSIGRRSQ